jgi:hypothetical protein
MRETKVEISDNIMSSYNLFKNQKNAFIEALKNYNHNIKIALDWRDLNEDNIRHKKNWFFVFYPPGWEISKGPGFGVFMGFHYYFEKRTETEYAGLHVGVESPMADEYKKQFKDEVVKELYKRRVNLLGFDIWPNAGLRKTNLLRIDFPLDNNSWKRAIEYYKKLDSFVSIISEKIGNFKKRGYFK